MGIELLMLPQRFFPQANRKEVRLRRLQGLIQTVNPRKRQSATFHIRSMTELDETMKEFLIESFENLDQLDRDLLMLELEPENNDIINRIFRTVHTVKGTCGFFELRVLESVSHVGENLLDNLRNGSLKVNPQIITGLLKLGDALRALLNRVEARGSDAGEAYNELIALLEQLNKPSSAKEHGAAPQADETPKRVPSEEEKELEALFAQGRAAYEAAQIVTTPDSSPIPTVAKQLGASEIKASTEVVAKNSQTEEAKKSELADTALRVDVHLLDNLMNLVGELVLARNQILQFTKSYTNPELIQTSQRLNLITSELQEKVMRTRMQPISNVWNKLPRIVRDISLSCGKQVRVEMTGKETELDKTIIEAIKDPLTHIIRNAVDHGIEDPERRKSAGKDPEGTLSLRAFHEGGQVIIEISDDGAGLNLSRIREKAIAKNLIPGDRIGSLSDHDIHQLIFVPGFSTAEKVTNISGRGVGMDVVRSNIERIGGTVEVSSIFGQSATFTIKIPLTLAIIPALVVLCGDSRFAIPQVNLLELVRIDASQVNTQLEEIQGAIFYRLRGRLLPVVYLREELELGSFEHRDSEMALNIVVVRADNHQFGLVVEGICDTEEIVVKPLGGLLKGLSAFAGATIMGDGKVALILDVVGLAKKAGIAKCSSAFADTSQSLESETNADRERLLVIELRDHSRAAVLLDEVDRLEDFSVAQIEQSGGRPVVQYRGGILPLIDLDHFFGGGAIQYEDSVKALVHSKEGVMVGFIIKQVIDVVEQSISPSSLQKRSGLSGTAVVQGKVTDLLDLEAILQASGLVRRTPHNEEVGAWK